MHIKKGFTRGDTLIEVIFAVAIFSAVSMSVMTTMNRMLSDAQASIESVMARSAIDAQAEAIRFIHSSFTEAEPGQWSELISNTISPDDVKIAKNITSCDDSSLNNNGKAFAIDTRDLWVVSSSEIGTSPLYPRFIYDDSETYDQTLDNGNRIGVEGIWVTAVRDTGNPSDRTNYYDFYIQTCWYAPGNGMPRTISTVIRLNNPSIVAPIPTYEASPDVASIKYMPAENIPDSIVTSNGEDNHSHGFSHLLNIRKISDDSALVQGDTITIGTDEYVFEGFEVKWFDSDGNSGWSCDHSHRCNSGDILPIEYGREYKATAVFGKKVTYTIEYKDSGSITCNNKPANDSYGPTTGGHAFTVGGAPSGCNGNYGYSFNGWKANGSLYAAGDVINATSSSPNITMVASWKDTHPVEVNISVKGEWYDVSYSYDVSYPDTTSPKTIICQRKNTFGNNEPTIKVKDGHSGSIISTNIFEKKNRKCFLRGLLCDVKWTVGTVLNGSFTMVDNFEVIGNEGYNGCH